MAFVSQEMKAELAPKIKAICKKYGVKASIAVRHHSTLVLNIKSSKIDFITNFNETIAQRDPTGNKHINQARTEIQVNTSWAHEHFTGKAAKFFAEVIPAMKGPKFFDHSDAQTDYFHVSHYIDINVGQWNKPFVVEK